jgi:transcriptional regulator with XRE-family HTH domain
MTKSIQCAKGHNTRAALQANGISQSELAKMLGIHATNVSQWCVRGVSKSHADEVAELLDVPVGSIINKRRARKIKAAPPQPAPRAELPKTQTVDTPNGKTVALTGAERELLDIEIITKLMDCHVTKRQKAVLEQLMKQFIHNQPTHRRYA